MIRSLRDEIDRKQVSHDKNLQKATQKKRYGIQGTP